MQLLYTQHLTDNDHFSRNTALTSFSLDTDCPLVPNLSILQDSMKYFISFDTIAPDLPSSGVIWFSLDFSTCPDHLNLPLFIRDVTDFESESDRFHQFFHKFEGY